MIFCSSCRPVRGNDQFEECVISFKGRSQSQYFLNFDLNRNGMLSESISSASGLKFRIYAPPTSVTYEEVLVQSNCKGRAPVPVSWKVRSSVSIKSSSSHSITTQQQISWSTEFTSVLSGLSTSLSHSWTMQETLEALEFRELIIGAGARGYSVQPGKKWIVLQKTGNIGYWKIRPFEIRAEDRDCRPEELPAENKTIPSPLQSLTNQPLIANHATSLHCPLLVIYSSFLITIR